MGCCVSTSSQISCSSGSNGETNSLSCLGVSLCGKISRKSSDHINMLKHLASMPDRMFTNGKSQSSCIFTQQGRKGINQDAMIVWEDFTDEDTTFCGVFDGHGPHGHLVARKVRDALPLMLQTFLDCDNYKQNNHNTACCKGSNNIQSDGEPEKVKLIEEDKESMWKEAFLKSYKAMDKELRSHPHLDCFCSGSTAVTVVKKVILGILEQY